AVKIATDANVGRVAVITNSLILGHICTANVFRTVRRSVVGNNQFEISVGLCEQRIQTRFKIAFTVIDRKTYAHTWLATVHVDFSVIVTLRGTGISDLRTGKPTNFSFSHRLRQAQYYRLKTETLLNHDRSLVDWTKPKNRLSAPTGRADKVQRA